MAKQDPAALSEAQLEIMNVVWDRGEVTVADVWKAQGRDLARNTVQTMLVRLEEKGWLRHREVDGRFVYRARVRREKNQRSLVERLVESAFEGSAEGLVHALLEGRGLSADEARRIRTMIEEAERESP